MQSDVVTESRPHSSKPSDLCALRRLSIARIVEEDAVIPRDGQAPAPSRVVNCRGRTPSVAPALSLQISFLFKAKIQIASHNAELALFSHSCERLIWASWLSLASRSPGRAPDSACVFKMVQPLQRVVIRWRPFADTGNGNDVVLSEPYLITVTLK